MDEAQFYWDDITPEVVAVYTYAACIVVRQEYVQAMPDIGIRSDAKFQLQLPPTWSGLLVAETCFDSVNLLISVQGPGDHNLHCAFQTTRAHLKELPRVLSPA